MPQHRQGPEWEGQLTDLTPVPHSFEAEEQVLASILSGDPDAWKVAKRMLQPSDFYRDRNQFIFAAFGRVTKEGRRINEITVAHDLALQGGDLLKSCGGAAYLAMLVANMMSSLFAEDYAWVVKDCSERRGLLGKAREPQSYETKRPPRRKESGIGF